MTDEEVARTGVWRTKLPDVESSVWGRFPEVWRKAHTCPAKAGARRFLIEEDPICFHRGHQIPQLFRKIRCLVFL
jgi:hypothetical protein